MKFFLSLLTIFLFTGVTTLDAQELHDDYQGTFKAEVTEVLEKTSQPVAGTETEDVLQIIEAKVLTGPQIDEVITINEDFLGLDVGDTFYFNHYQYLDGEHAYGLVGVARTTPIIFLVALFAAAVILLGGWQGVRSLLALAGSFLAIFYILLPGLLAGWNPLVGSFLIAAIVLFGAIFFTHGFNRESLVAYSGTMFAVVTTSLFAVFAVTITKLTGLASDEAAYLDINTAGTLDFTSLLLGAIIIGVLGVLDDIAVTQAAVVTELYNSNKNISKSEVFWRALRVGREHVGALVNTLILAYTGAALPLILYSYASPTTFEMAVNSEIFATEIVRSVVGSLGLILTVPVVTGLAVIYLKNYRPAYKKHSHHGHVH